MERAHDEFCSNNHLTLAVYNMFTHPDTAHLVTTSIRPGTWLFGAIQRKIQEMTSCPVQPNREVLLPCDKEPVVEMYSRREEQKDKHTHTWYRSGLPPQTSFVRLAMMAPRSPRSPLSSRPLLSPHSFFQNLSRFFNSACVWADVQKTSLRQQGGGNSSDSAQALCLPQLPPPFSAPRLRFPSFSCSLFSFNTLSD